ncbi:MAG: hypothetical protein KIH63_001805 [Candidatus Saccharibacteria bacterium]|nr:hypothetical protein [Candidatus Saccharibacteria bacterium]
MDLEKYRKSETSQWGEDGVIAEIFKRIGTKSKIAVEFGSWDGKYLSNIWDLWHNKDWHAVLIESDKKRSDEAQREYKAFDKVKFVTAFVEAAGENSLENILTREIGSQVPDLISIDIDSDDYYIFESLKEHLPRVVVIEFNPSIPPHVEAVQSPGQYFGASALSQLKLGKKKGYSLAFVTKTNLILVNNKDFAKLKIKEVELTLDNFPHYLLTYIISSYDGSPIMIGTPPFVSPKAMDEVADMKRYQAKTPKIASHSIETMQPVTIFAKAKSKKPRSAKK